MTLSPFQALCRDCLEPNPPPPPPAPPSAPVPAPKPAPPPAPGEGDIPGAGVRCQACGSPRILAHPELASLTLAHIDCDAFYASLEKRDAPDLADRPVIVGGGRRGVVAACCYVARLDGVRSAMPMYEALARCPNAVVKPPDMARYRREGLRIRHLMQTVTPLVEPLSIDEAFLDLSGTDALHGGPPALTLARLAATIEREVGVTVSVGLAPNKFLAKLASEMDKPRGFAVIGRNEAHGLLTDKPVGVVPGAGPALQAALKRDGIERLGQLRRLDEATLVARYGAMGRRLWHFVHGVDSRPVEPNAPAKSLSAETTFDADIADPATLSRRLWPLCETVARRLKDAHRAGGNVTLKLKTAQFRTLTRSRRLDSPTQLAERLYRTAMPLLTTAADGRPFRLIGVGAGDLVAGDLADPPDLADPERGRQARIEAAMDKVRGKLGPGAVMKGRGFGVDSGRG